MTARLSGVSTDSVEPSERLELWETDNSQELIGLRCSTDRPEGLRASQVNLDLGGLRVASILGDAHVVERSTREARRIPKDAVFMALVLEGSGFFHDASGTRNLRAGDALIYDAARPHLFAFATVVRQHMLDIPRDLLGTAPAQPLLVHRGSPSPTPACSRWVPWSADCSTGPGRPGPATRSCWGSPSPSSSTRSPRPRPCAGPPER